MCSRCAANTILRHQIFPPAPPHTHQSHFPLVCPYSLPPSIQALPTREKRWENKNKKTKNKIPQPPGLAPTSLLEILLYTRSPSRRNFLEARTHLHIVHACIYALAENTGWLTYSPAPWSSPRYVCTMYVGTYVCTYVRMYVCMCPLPGTSKQHPCLVNLRASPAYHGPGCLSWLLVRVCGFGL